MRKNLPIICITVAALIIVVAGVWRRTGSESEGTGVAESGGTSLKVGVAAGGSAVRNGKIESGVAVRGVENVPEANSKGAASAVRDEKGTMPPVSGNKDVEGFEIYEWPNGRPHFEGEAVEAFVSLGETGRRLRFGVNQMGEYPRVQIAPEEEVSVRLQFAVSEPGKKVAIAAQDGGKIEGSRASEALVLDERRQVAFRFKASANEGVHRVTFTTESGEGKILDFWAGPLNTLRSTDSR
jgi:hypothetical protein